jgi:hypothetical protein
MGTTPSQDKDERYSEADAARRSEAALKRMLSTPHKPHKAAAKKRNTKKPTKR